MELSPACQVSVAAFTANYVTGQSGLDYLVLLQDGNVMRYVCGICETRTPLRAERQRRFSDTPPACAEHGRCSGQNPAGCSQIGTTDTPEGLS